MNQNTQPLVSIGLPVFNGEDYLESSLDTLFSQSYQNIEIVVCDNASTDNTQSIVERYRSKDERIKYHRHKKNLGAALNYNRTFELSTGKYFKWAAHDDIIHENYIEQCVLAMEHDELVSLVQPLTGQIDGDGNDTGHLYTSVNSLIPDNTSDRELYRILIQDRGAWVRIFGLIRSSVLKKTPLIDNYVGSDLTLLGELGLNGKVRDIDTVMFWRREHAGTSTTGKYKVRRKRLNWFDTSQNPKITLPEWRLNYEMFNSITRQNIPLSRKLSCGIAVLGRMWIKKRLLIEDIYFAIVDFVNSKRASSKIRNQA